jgi:hypothetical protein
MSKKSLPLSHVYRLLEPGPVVLVSTAGRTRANIMTLSWHTMMEFEPPLVGCVISGRNTVLGTHSQPTKLDPDAQLKITKELPSLLPQPWQGKSQESRQQKTPCFQGVP